MASTLPNSVAKLTSLKRKAKREGWSQYIRGEIDERAMLLEGCTFDHDRANHVCEFVETFIRHGTGEWYGSPFVLLDWQRDLLERCFGWVRPDHTRRHRTCYVEVGKKNGKSFLLSSICAYMLVADQEPGAHIFNVASSTEQASILFRNARSFIEASPELSRYLEIIPSTKRIVFEQTGSFWRVLATNAATAEGISAHMMAFDELHVQKSQELFRALEYAGRARRQPLCPFVITTAGVFNPSSIAWEIHRYTEDVNSGVVHDTRHLGVIYSIDEDDDWTTENPECEQVWKKANPSLGTTIKLDDFRADVQAAMDYPSKTASFLRYSLDVWTQSAERSINIEKWKKNSGPVDVTKWEDNPIFVAIDLSSHVDTTGLVAICFVNNKWEVFPMCWIPEENINQKQKRERALYEVWKEQKYLRTTRGSAIDYEEVLRDILEFLGPLNVQTIALDPWNAQWIASQLQDQHGYHVEYFRQGFISMSPAIKELERRYLDEEFSHDNHPVLTHHASCVKHKTDDAGNIKYIKDNEGSRIDLLICLAMACGVSIEPDQQESIYETQGALWL